MLLGSMAQNAFAQKIEIKGTVRDASDKSIEYVNVVLQTIDSTFVAGVTTSPEGEFIFKNTAAGDYRLVLSSIGYNTGYITLNQWSKAPYRPWTNRIRQCFYRTGRSDYHRLQPNQPCRPQTGFPIRKTNENFHKRSESVAGTDAATYSGQPHEQ